MVSSHFREIQRRYTAILLTLRPRHRLRIWIIISFGLRIVICKEILSVVTFGLSSCEQRRAEKFDKPKNNYLLFFINCHKLCFVLSSPKWHWPSSTLKDSPWFLMFCYLCHKRDISWITFARDLPLVVRTYAQDWNVVWPKAFLMTVHCRIKCESYDFDRLAYRWRVRWVEVF